MTEQGPIGVQQWCAHVANRSECLQIGVMGEKLERHTHGGIYASCLPKHNRLELKGSAASDLQPENGSR